MNTNNSHIETISLSDLKEVKSIIEDRLLKKEQWMNAERGRNYEEYCRRELVYNKDENHEKLKRINQRIESFIKAI